MRRLIVGLLAFGMVATPRLTAAPVRAVDCFPTDPYCSEIKDAKADQANKAQQLEDIKTRISDTQARAAAVSRLIIQLDGQIKSQQAQIDQTQTKLDALDKQIRLTQADIARREAHISVRKQVLDQRVRNVDKHGSINYVELIVTSTNFNQLIDRVMIMNDIVRSDHLLLADLRDQQDQVTALKVQLDGKRLEQAKLLQQQQDQQAALQKTRKDQQDAFDYLRSLEAQYEQQRKQLEAEKAAIDARLAQLQAAYDAWAASVGGGLGRFGWPEGSHYITQGFGCSTLLGEPYDPSVCPVYPYRAHTGIDIGGPWGSPIYATDAGVVSYISSDGWGGGYGNYVIISHGNGYATLSAHLSSVSVGRNQIVHRGDVIGAEGSTGFSTGPHLHYEIRRNGAYLNPCAFLGC